jgi:hypothetical protein
LAIFVRLAAGHFWDICCWVWFHFRLTPQARDGLYHQQQVLLRNNLTDSRALWQFSTLALAWRGKARRPLLRSLPFILAAVLHFAAFTTAGIFASRVTRAHSVVKITGPSCGYTKEPETYDQKGMIQEAEMTAGAVDIWKTSQVQALSCHSFNTIAVQQSTRDCKAWGRSFVPFTIKQNVACPFAPEMCIDDLAVEVQSTLVDSNYHLGINAPHGDRIAVRTVSTMLTLDFFRSHLAETPMRSYRARWLQERARLVQRDWPHGRLLRSRLSA